MELGTRYKTIEEVVAIVEQELGIAMRRSDDSETGIRFLWFVPPDERGISYHGIDVAPTRVFDEEEGRTLLMDEYWKPYTFVIGLSEELIAHVDRVRELIRQGLLKTEEIHRPPRY